MSSIVKSWVLDSEDDRDILDWLESLDRGEQSKAIRDIVRAYIQKQPKVTLESLRAEIMAQFRQLKQGGITVKNDTPSEPDKAASSLDNLLDRLDNW